MNDVKPLFSKKSPEFIQSQEIAKRRNFSWNYNRSITAIINIFRKLFFTSNNRDLGTRMGKCGNLSSQLGLNKKVTVETLAMRTPSTPFELK